MLELRNMEDRVDDLCLLVGGMKAMTNLKGGETGRGRGSVKTW